MSFQSRFETDLHFYYSMGAFVIIVYLIGIAVIALISPANVNLRTLIPLTIGFFLFMFVYFISISVQVLEPDEQ